MIFFLLASEFDMVYECVPSEIILQTRSKYENKIEIKNVKQLEENDWHVNLDKLTKCLK